MQSQLTERSQRILLTYVALNILNAQITYSAKGTVQEVHIDSKFECKASHRLSMKASSEIQCVQRCAKNEKCELLNYNYQWKEKGIEENCEIYMLSRYDSSCKTAPNMKGWKAAIYNDTERCRYLKFNFCFPCNCKERRCAKGRASNCTCFEHSPVFPEIFISFENVLTNKTVAYERGADKQGNSTVTLKGSASIGPSKGRIGNALRMVGIDPGAVIGEFKNHPLNNPKGKTFTFAFWIKVTSASNSSQIVVRSGKNGTNSDTGFAVRLHNYARVVKVRCIDAGKVVLLHQDIGDTLAKWTHIAITKHQDQWLSLYVNGIHANNATQEVTSRKSSATGYTKLAFGVEKQCFTLNGEHCGLYIDDVAYWSVVLSDAEIKHVMKEDFASCLV
ncbi:uncharacterized protein LOC135690997 [Rhopilema esculentum]|uniref:uncharacterized protein LOC135690997 n=1 Tax=Rhopilema esculentum TaxID=499914 RepID=UPI0031D17FD7